MPFVFSTIFYSISINEVHLSRNVWTLMLFFSNLNDCLILWGFVALW